MKVSVKAMGKAHLFTFENNTGASCSITDRAGAIVAINVPDKKGVIENVVLGFEDEKQYINNKGYLGALIGPVGNRIAGASFDFNGKHYEFPHNENGSTLLHSGPNGWHSVIWDAVAEADENEGRLVLKHEFKSEVTGFPGDQKVTVTYTFTNDNKLSIHYHIDCDTPSFASPTNHTYFNIGGLGGKHIPKVDRQVVQIFADKYTVVDEKCIPVAVQDVTGTPFDLRNGKKLKEGFAVEKEDAQLTIGAGYDHNFVLGEGGEVKLTCRVTDSYSGRIMDVYTDMPSVQLYTANHLNRYDAATKRFYKARQALCLETQCAPDSVHHADGDGYKTLYIDAEHPFDSVTTYAFSVKA